MSAVQEELQADVELEHAELNPRVVLPPGDRPLTVDDLDMLADDGRRYELLDGMLLVSPAPVPRHQGMVTPLLVLLWTRAPEHLWVLPGPIGVRLADDTELQPDIVVAPRVDFGEKYLSKPPLLAVEVLSPSTRLVDLNLKKAAYERFGSPSYWVLDPDPGDPFLIVYELDDGRDREMAHVRGDDHIDVERPFPVRLRPSDLAAGRVPDQA